MNNANLRVKTRHTLVAHRKSATLAFSFHLLPLLLATVIFGAGGLGCAKRHSYSTSPTTSALLVSGTNWKKLEYKNGIGALRPPGDYLDTSLSVELDPSTGAATATKTLTLKAASTGAALSTNSCSVTVSAEDLSTLQESLQSAVISTHDIELYACVDGGYSELTLQFPNGSSQTRKFESCDYGVQGMVIFSDNLEGLLQYVSGKISCAL